VDREKGRKYKGVTLSTGIPLDQEALKQFAKQLKAKCGSGGTFKNGGDRNPGGSSGSAHGRT